MAFVMQFRGILSPRSTDRRRFLLLLHFRQAKPHLVQLSPGHGDCTVRADPSNRVSHRLHLVQLPPDMATAPSQQIPPRSQPGREGRYRKIATLTRTSLTYSCQSPLALACRTGSLPRLSKSAVLRARYSVPVSSLKTGGLGSNRGRSPWDGTPGEPDAATDSQWVALKAGRRPR